MAHPTANYKGDGLNSHLANHARGYTDKDRIEGMVVDIRGFLVAAQGGKHPYRFGIKEAVRLTREIEDKLHKVRCSQCGRGV